jgi:hypothetical protein
MKTNNEIIKKWKEKSKSPLINDIVKIIKNRKGYNCIHCDRQYDDDICDACFGVFLVNKFEESLIKTEKELTKGA